MKNEEDADAATSGKGYTRIQKRNRATIFAAALDVFSQRGLSGSTLEQVASRANMSKPNLLYYFSSKEAVFVELIDRLMEIWLDPLRLIDPDGDPVEEILNYVHRKLEISRLKPRESRLFAIEIIQGAPNISGLIKGPLKTLVDEKAKTIEKWSDEGKIKRIDPYQLIFSIWATTQNYADFAPQFSLITPQKKSERYDSARTFLDTLFRSLLIRGPD